MSGIEAVGTRSEHRRAARGFLSDAYLLGAVAVAIRALLVVWASHRFPPADDGTFYHVVAQRIASGAGYTWLWPDGAVSYAAHYPVGYPALLGAAYALFGSSPVVAMSVNAWLGALAAFAAQRIVIRRNSRRAALLAGLLIALHPGLVFYTPALMTEGVAAELLVVAVWLAFRVDDRGRPAWRLVALAGLMGFLTLVRPQLLILAPLLGFFALGSLDARYSERLLRAALVGFLAICFCLPWTIRNCKRMDRCVFVSANGGWNLLIGAAPEAGGAWRAIDGESVPPECRSVFGEADKDRCFGRAGWRKILADPLGFLALMPRKLSVTFDYFGAPGHYLHSSNGREFDQSRKVRLGVLETIWERIVLLAAIARAAWPGTGVRVGRLRWAPMAAAALAGVFALTRAGWLGYLGLVVVTLLAGRKLVERPIAALAAGLTLATALTHAVFFGAGRYGFVCAALLCVAALGENEGRGSEGRTPAGPT